MKTREIKVGKKYTNGRGSVREVIAEGDQYAIYPGQSDRDCILYRVVDQSVPDDVIRPGQERSTTRNSFASWAKEEVQ